VAQIEELSFAHFHEKRDALLAALDTFRKRDGLLFSALLVTDINTRCRSCSCKVPTRSCKNRLSAEQPACLGSGGCRFPKEAAFAVFAALPRAG